MRLQAREQEITFATVHVSIKLACFLRQYWNEQMVAEYKRTEVTVENLTRVCTECRGSRGDKLSR